tara:strand:- start:110 stop:1177 length:1068 start_codon:yes stop_codon:yes gene_type:complete
MNKDFWKNKKVFLTGHTGFKGSWTSIMLNLMGANVKGYSLEPNSKPNLFNIARVNEEMESEIGDVRDYNKLYKSIKKFNPDILIHMAAQPLVRYSYQNPVETYSTNVMGTLNVLECSRYCSNLKSIVIITSDKCYENKEIDYSYKETDPMGGFDPYSSSKGCCELLVSSYRRSFFNNNSNAFLATARAGNVIGGGDWSEDRLVPDILNCFQKSKVVKIRSPKAIRPWQHVIEPIKGYLILAEKLYNSGNKFAEGWNFGPDLNDCKSVEWIVNIMCKKWGKDAAWSIDDKFKPHEAKLLSLNNSKAKQRLNWIPKWSIEYTIDNIIDWHLNWINKENMKNQCIKQINNFLNNQENE